MKKLEYSCKKELLHTDISAVFEEQNLDDEALKFQAKRSYFYQIKFIIFIVLRVFGWRHYETMGILGYESYLLNETLVKKITGKTHGKLLDIGAGEGSITKKFEKYTQSISCLEPSKSFQRKLKKRGYDLITSENKSTYEFVTIFNVLDRCEDPTEILRFAYEHTKNKGSILMSLPFPIVAKGQNSDIRKTNRLTQVQTLGFEKAVSDFYINFLQKNNLTVIYFTRLPYIVLLPESENTNVYDAGLFVCQKSTTEDL